MPNSAPATSALIRNPVLRGFNPDPSFVRVGDDFYLATSTFEWLPGVRFHHSRDLVHWRLAGHALTRPAHIDLRGVDNSNGVWAPSLSHADGQFWLIYTNVRTAGAGRPFKDSHVYLITAPSIEGPWSDPVHLNSIGFDPSLFHDDDGRKWLVNMQWDFRKRRYRFAGIVLQEFDPATCRLVGPVQEILRKPNILCEGPNLYKYNGYYYLLMAEGGTGWNHGISMARARAITGPYDLDPAEAVLTTRHAPEHPLQKAGHGELVRTRSGEWWLAHLCSRPLKTSAPARADADPLSKARAGYRCLLGRETALQRVEWTPEGWLRLAGGGVLPELEVTAPAELPPHPWPARPEHDSFESIELDRHWCSLRVLPSPSWLSLTERPGWLRMRARECPSSLHEQSLVAQWLTTFRATIDTRIEFSPTRYSQMAGLVAWYDTRMFYYLRVSHDERLGKMVGVVLMDDGVYDELDDASVAVGDWPAVYLRVKINRAELQFFASPDGYSWLPVGSRLDASKLSDDYPQGLHFTGAFVGLAAHDTAGQGAFADFDYFTLRAEGD